MCAPPPKSWGPRREASGGGVFWVGDGAIAGRAAGLAGPRRLGRSWIGLRQNGDYVVTGFGEVPLLPAVAALLLAIGLLLAAWRREGR